MEKWYETNTGNHQGLIISEDTGKNIAVSYDKADAKLIAAAPDLLEACQKALQVLHLDSDMEEDFAEEIKTLTSAIQKATD